MGTFQSGITIKKGILTNGAALPGQDYISGLMFFNDTPPSLFPSSGYKQCFSIQDAIDVGITNNHEGETKAVAKYVISSYGAAGDIISIYAQEPIDPTNTDPNPNRVTLCTYTATSADSTIALLGASIAAAINAGTYIHGYTASFATATLLITFRPGLGIFPNSGTPISVSITGTIAGTITQPTGSAGTTLGVASAIDVYYYHVSEYFRMNSNGELWVAIYDVPGTYTFTEVETLQLAAKGTLRQIGVYVPGRTVVSNIAADVVALNTVLDGLDTDKMPLSAVLAEDMKSVTDLTTLPTLSTLNSEWVSVNISQDGNAEGFSLFNAYGKSITNLGALIGTISVNSVSADIAQPIPQNNITNAVENEVPAFANGALFTSVSKGLQTHLDNYRYIYTGNFVGYVGTYFNDSHCAIVQNSNYAWIEENRVQAKIERLMYAAYLPYLKSQLDLNEDGTLTQVVVSSLESVGDEALRPMVQASELSGVRTVINPAQDVTTSGKLIVTLYEQNKPIARSIEIVTNSVTTLP